MKISFFYILMVVVVCTGIMGVLQLGSSLPMPQSMIVEASETTVVTTEQSAFSGLIEALRANLDHPLSHLFVQLLVIIGASRVMGKTFTRLGQPAVVGEMAAGIMLGPSLFGLLAPEAFAFVFPEDSLGTLKLLSQIGVCLFMFAVGMELDVRQVRSNAHVAVAVSHASIVFPYLLGVLLAYFYLATWPSLA